MSVTGWCRCCSCMDDVVRIGFMTNESVEVVMHVRKNNPTRTIAALGCCCGCGCCCCCATMVVDESLGIWWSAAVVFFGKQEAIRYLTLAALGAPVEHDTAIRQYTSQQIWTQ